MSATPPTSHYDDSDPPVLLVVPVELRLDINLHVRVPESLSDAQNVQEWLHELLSDGQVALGSLSPRTIDVVVGPPQRFEERNFLDARDRGEGALDKLNARDRGVWPVVIDAAEGELYTMHNGRLRRVTELQLGDSTTAARKGGA